MQPRMGVLFHGQQAIITELSQENERLRKALQEIVDLKIHSFEISPQGGSPITVEGMTRFADGADADRIMAIVRDALQDRRQ